MKNEKLLATHFDDSIVPNHLIVDKGPMSPYTYTTALEGYTYRNREHLVPNNEDIVRLLATCDHDVPDTVYTPGLEVAEASSTIDTYRKVYGTYRKGKIASDSELTLRMQRIMLMYSPIYLFGATHRDYFREWILSNIEDVYIGKHVKLTFPDADPSTAFKTPIVGEMPLYSNVRVGEDEIRPWFSRDVLYDIFNNKRMVSKRPSMYHPSACYNVSMITEMLEQVSMARTRDWGTTINPVSVWNTIITQLRDSTVVDNTELVTSGYYEECMEILDGDWTRLRTPVMLIHSDENAPEVPTHDIVTMLQRMATRIDNAADINIHATLNRLLYKVTREVLYNMYCNNRDTLDPIVAKYNTLEYGRSVHKNLGYPTFIYTYRHMLANGDL